jgi:hypothetical protein
MNVGNDCMARGDIFSSLLHLLLAERTVHPPLLPKDLRHLQAHFAPTNRRE